MTEYEEIAALDDSGRFSGDLAYGKTRYPSVPRYKVWNADPRVENQVPSPGVVMKVTEGSGDNKTSTTETVESVRSVILFTSYGRKVVTGSGKNFRTLCSSHDGHTPSLKIDEPLCRKASASDLAKIFSQWKGYDQVKVDAQIREVTQGTGELQVCGLKSKNGTIALCPYSKKDPLTGTRGPCKEHIFIEAFDLDRERNYRMELTGKSIWNSDFVAPFHEFFKFLKTGGPQKDGKPIPMPCYAFEVQLSALKDGKFYLANFTNWKPLPAEERVKMRTFAENARDAYDKDAARISKEAYEKIQKEIRGNAPRVEPTAQPTASKFDDDDIPFMRD